MCARVQARMEGDGDHLLFSTAVLAAFAFAVLFFLSLSKMAAPYGRHHSPLMASSPSTTSRLLLPTRLAWSLMESPALFLTPLVFALGRHASQPVPRALGLFFIAHYAHRVLVYPLRMRPSRARNVPPSIVLSSLLFNLYNAYIQGRSLSHYTTYSPAWLSRPPFLLGACLFAAGMAINIWADSALIALRRTTADRTYRVPRGGLFELVTCPNYLGEMLEWLGWALLTWSAAGLGFFLLTAGNLVPRAVAHHRWYLKNFSNYPRSRKILVPFLF